MERAKSCQKIVSYCWITYIGSIQSNAQEQHYQKCPVTAADVDIGEKFMALQFQP